MPPYWSLGFHLCKWGYENITVVKDVVERTKQAEISQVKYILGSDKPFFQV
jgi:alpha-glucosidase (family GH31 glycosyl hydrolase)